MLLTASALAVPAGPVAPIEIPGKGQHLRLELLDDKLVHLQWSGAAARPPAILDDAIWTSPMVVKTRHPGPSHWRYEERKLVETPALRLEIEGDSGRVTVIDRTTGTTLARLTPGNLGSDRNLSLEIATDATHAYGLGEFPRAGGTEQDWVGSRAVGGPDGNVMQGYFSGANAYTQFPMLYGLGSHGESFGLFLDQPYRVEWDLTDRKVWKAVVHGDALRAYLMVGDDLPALRGKLLDLTGRPPVPPKSVFGFGISQFGYRNWDEIFQDIDELQGVGVPVRMVALDLQWFGGTFVDPGQVPEGNVNSLMGQLTWDTKNFPEPEKRLRELKGMGVDVMPISESYVHGKLAEYEQGRRWDLFATLPNGSPAWVTRNPWWGKGPIIDWTSPRSGRWIEEKYLPMVRDEISSFWLDLGEPEMKTDEKARYHGYEALGRHSGEDIYNVYNLFWAKRIVDGLGEKHPNRRFFTFSRSGTIGLQRYGGKWGGDTGSGFQELLGHLQNRILNLPLVGIDYYASDVGGFHRGALAHDRPKLDRLFTQWLADSLMLDFPVRAHLWNLDRIHPYLPTRLGDVKSNIANIRLRYELLPYYYGAAHRAWREGTPLVAPLVYRYQRDPNVRRLGNVALVGDDLLVAIVANEQGETKRDVYLPAGDWYDYHSQDRHSATTGRYLPNVSTLRNGLFRLPLFVRAGTILPLGDGQGETASELRLRVYPGAGRSERTLVEDDGWSNDYRREETARRTTLVQEGGEGALAVTVRPARGTYAKASPRRRLKVEVVVGARPVRSVTVDGAAMAAGAGGYTIRGGLLSVPVGSRRVDRETRVEILH